MLEIFEKRNRGCSRELVPKYYVKQISSSKVLKLFWVENWYPQPSTHLLNQDLETICIQAFLKKKQKFFSKVLNSWRLIKIILILFTIHYLYNRGLELVLFQSIHTNTFFKVLNHKTHNHTSCETNT